MLILAIDTSGETCSVAVNEGTICRAEYSFLHKRHLSERLPGIIEFLLRDTGVTLKEIELFAVGRGPGSFTGVRVGVTMAKVWAMTLDKPVVGVSSLDALAEPFRASERPRIAVAPTRRKESVAAFYPSGSITPIQPPAVIANAALLEIAQRELVSSTKYLLLGETADAILRDEYSAGEQADRIETVTTSISAAVVARLAYADLLRGAGTDADTLVPLYVTPPPTG